jgi:hypothetical protein
MATFAIPLGHRARMEILEKNRANWQSEVAVLSDSRVCLPLDYSWRSRQCAAQKKHAKANRMKAVDSTRARNGLPSPIVSQQR